jgi:4-carboxymuconolactone decarboxylase
MGDVWSRPGLDAAQRSLVTIALLTALNRPEQLRAYLAVGLNQGLTRAQVCEVILHTAVYAGFPAAIEGFRIATEVFAAYDEAAGPTG